MWIRYELCIHNNFNTPSKKRHKRIWKISYWLLTLVETWHQNILTRWTEQFLSVTKNSNLYVWNWNLKVKNAAGVPYAERDRYYLIEMNRDLIESRNAKMLEIIHKYTNQNIRKSELMGTNLMGVNVLKTYKKSKC